MERTAGEPAVVEPHSPGTLHHVHVITGKVRTGPVVEPVDLAAGDFARFPGDVPHHFSRLTDRATVHMVTTVPQIRRARPTVVKGGVPGQDG